MGWEHGYDLLWDRIDVARLEVAAREAAALWPGVTVEVEQKGADYVVLFFEAPIALARERDWMWYERFDEELGPQIPDVSTLWLQIDVRSFEADGDEPARVYVNYRSNCSANRVGSSLVSELVDAIGKRLGGTV